MSDAKVSSNYELLRQRLATAASDLKKRFDQLSAARKQTFGSLQTKLLTTAHVATANASIPRDLAGFSDRLLLGVNAHFALRSEIFPNDLFAGFRLDEEGHAHEISLAVLDDAAFRRDLAELFKYYKNTTFDRFATSDSFLYAVFQVGTTSRDQKAFKFAVSGSELQYLHPRGASELPRREPWGIRWRRVTRDMHRDGPHPHVSIDDIVFVECVGGDLTIKVEDNTGVGTGIYAEPVEQPDQTLDDAVIEYCILRDLVLLRIQPYREKVTRHLVYSVKRQSVLRIDALAQGCALLPEDHGIIFPAGYVLQSGEHKLLDHGVAGLVFDSSIASPNGEDHLFCFFAVDTGSYVLLRYNVIEQRVDTPVICHGYALFEDGRMLTVRSSEVAAKTHAIQIWQTPFTGPDYQRDVDQSSMLYKIGNRELVRAMADVRELLRLVGREESYAGLYDDLRRRSTNLLDVHFWIDRPETFDLAGPIRTIRDTAEVAIEEFAKVQRIREQTAKQLADVERQSAELFSAIDRQPLDTVPTIVERLSDLRRLLGQIIALRELPYIDEAAVTRLAEVADQRRATLGQRSVQFLLRSESLDSYRQELAEISSKIDSVGGAAAGKALLERVTTLHDRLNLLVETISQLEIEDVTQRTAIIDPVAALFGDLNQIRSRLTARVRELGAAEMQADFGIQMRLLDQTVAAAIEGCQTPGDVDTATAPIVLQIEELQSRFADHDDLLDGLEAKRVAVLDNFETRRSMLLQEQAAAASRLATAADRVLQSVTARAKKFTDENELRSFLVGDAMVLKVRSTADSLRQLGDAVAADDVLAKLQAATNNALRQLRDRRDLEVSPDTLRLGKHLFSVNRQPIELAIVPRGDSLTLHLTGTQFYEPIEHPGLAETRPIWNQPFRSENVEVYRGEFLAFELWQRLRGNQPNETQPWTPEEYLRRPIPERLEWIRLFMADHLADGYERGVHDVDADKILSAILQIDQSLGVLRYRPDLRAVADWLWQRVATQRQRALIQQWCQRFTQTEAALDGQLATHQLHRLIAGELQTAMTGLQFKYLPPVEPSTAAAYLTERLLSNRQTSAQIFVSGEAIELITAFRQHYDQERWDELRAAIAIEEIDEKMPNVADAGSNHISSAAEGNRSFVEYGAGDHSDNDRVDNDRVDNDRIDADAAAYAVTVAAVEDFAGQHIDKSRRSHLTGYVQEAAVAILLHSDEQLSLAKAASPRATTTVNDLVGNHDRLQGGQLSLDYHRFQERLAAYRDRVTPLFERLRTANATAVRTAKKELALENLKSDVLGSFVRNRLIDTVYLPLFADNLAKQMGTAGQDSRSDRMGLLLLLSPPGYGKTTLMEYVANQLGLVFVRVNGPTLGTDVRSLDPAAAGGAAAAEELKRLNMAFAFGNNVMLYVDDIQHCHAEFLQKFISLCDGTRRVDGVWNGQSRTFDLRGRRFVVAMAGNPYTESGGRFHVPDMLANRADVYNLGEVIGGATDAFELSYLENCLTASPILRSLMSLAHSLRIEILTADPKRVATMTVGGIATDSMADVAAMLQHLRQVRDWVLKVNAAYIASAAQSDSARTAPPFRLQGSYRNMNRLAERLSPLMQPEEVRQVFLTLYRQDAQTLGSESEANWLALLDLFGWLDESQRQRWDEVKLIYRQRQRFAGLADDEAATAMLKSLEGLRDAMSSIGQAIEQTGQAFRPPPPAAGP